ncbi:exodeoxyribonuclease VII small subunit [Timonella senegalensis]|uniref:exodeoxyribonuclease VII small subunit n=1 Tax=Timonella senegalensis TaxID=1465825 RepID=UPI0028AAD774|nr:exodeoxyribonuclease VII small subunit [Timonella senegalensis]
MTENFPTPSAIDAAAREQIAQLGYEEARDELIGIVQRLEAGSASLEASLALWERGELLAARCQEWLDGAKQRLEQARQSTSGSPSED